ncbi:MAG: acyl carrier protein [Bacilli bacterium]|nr:acyl carrier protein [Bacilli bacterium]
MTRLEIFNKLKELIKLANSSNGSLLEDVSEESDLRSDLGLTSIGVLYLAISIEQTFNIEFQDSSFDDFTNVKDVIDYIERNLK